jgi:rSAM/selenodomain-associated transferase 1
VPWLASTGLHRIDPVPRRRLLIFAKLPEPGRVKTRLIPKLGPNGAALLYEAFLDDTIARCRTVREVDLEVWAAGGESAPDDERGGAAYFHGRHPGLRLRDQVGADLGGRLRRAFETAFEERADHVVVTGSDHPTLPIGYVWGAFTFLVTTEVVVGPSTDGGYYLIGLRRRAWPKAGALFADMPWSTPDLLSAARERARSLGLRHVELPEWYDVDDPSDLPRLGRDADADSQTARALARLAARDETGRGLRGTGNDPR